MAASMDGRGNPSVLLKVLMKLITPANTQHSPTQDSSEQLLDSVLQENLELFETDLKNSDELQAHFGKYTTFLLYGNKKSFLDGRIISVRQQFANVCMCLLHRITDELVEPHSDSNTLPCNIVNQSQITEKSEKSKGQRESVPALSPDTLSVQQSNTVSAALQFIIVLGLTPYLSSGVGIPISQRLGPGQILLATTHDYNIELKDLDRVQYLLPVTKMLSSMIEVSSLKDIVLNKYLADLLCALIQMRYCAKVILQSLGLLRTNKTRAKISGSYSQLQDTALHSNMEPQVETLPSAQQNANSDNPTSSHSRLHKTIKGNRYSKTDEDEMKVYPHDEIPDIYLDCSGHAWTLTSVVEHCNKYIDRSIRESNFSHILKVLMMMSGRAKASSGSQTRTPPWFSRTVAVILRDVISVPPGVRHLIALFVDEMAGADSQEWQKCRAVAQIISHCPVSSRNIEQFYTSVAEQLLDILTTPEAEVSPLMLRTVGATVLELTSQQSELMDKVCLSVLFAPLMRLSNKEEYTALLSDEEIVLNEEALGSCVISLHRLFCVGQEPQFPLVEHLKHIAGILFSIFVVSRKGVSRLRQFCKDLVQAFLRVCPTSQAVLCLLELVLGDSIAAHVYPSLHTDISLRPGPVGGLQAQVVREKTLDMDSWTEAVDAVMDLLIDLGSDSLISELFLSLLQKLTDIVTMETEREEVILPARVLSPDTQKEKKMELKERISLVCLLAAIGEKFDAQVIHSGRHVLTFAKVTLERCVKICSFSTDDTTQTFEWETVSMALGLLTAVLGGAVELTEEDKNLLDDLLPLLTAVAENGVTEPSVREMADDLKVAVATRGLVWAELSKLKSESKYQDKAQSASKAGISLSSASGKRPVGKPLIQVLNETHVNDHSQPATGFQQPEIDVQSSDKVQRTTGQATHNRLEQAMEELCDPLLPVRGHGLISLTRMLGDRDGPVMGKQDLLLRVFLENLSHADSYIYLAAVNGLAALSDLCPDQVIPTLTSEFRTQCSRESTKSGEMTLKVGEAMVKATKRLGEIAPKYRDIFLPAILCGCRHDDALVRASSLSGLADVCRLLRFSVGSVQHEILTCCKDIMFSDPDPEPRKAATLTLTLLLRGFGKESLQALSDVLREIYRVLKQTLTRDPDEKVRLQANLALGELDDIMREILFAKPELQKTITILGYQ